MSGVQVLSDSHPRQGGMDEDERTQCIHDIVNWFQRKADLSARGAKSADLDELEKELGRDLPEALRDLLKKQSGGLWFDEYKSLTPAEIVRSAEKLAGVSGWKATFIPFAADVDGNALITDVGSKNAVFLFDDDGKGRQVGATLSQYLEEYRNRLLSGQFDFVEDVGLVERSRK